MYTEPNKSLRLVRMVAESVLKERILVKDELDQAATTLIVGQIADIVEAMQVEWESDPTSGELRNVFRLLSDYIACLTDLH